MSANELKLMFLNVGGYNDNPLEYGIGIAPRRL